MLKIKNIVLAGLLAFLASACTMPDYQMQFDVTNTSASVSAPYYVDVTCSLANVGDKKLYNAMVQVEVKDGNSTTITYTKWSTGTDISTGDSVTRVVHIPLTAQYTGGSARIIAAGWDSENK